jgi:hypothetical protein
MYPNESAFLARSHGANFPNLEKNNCSDRRLCRDSCGTDLLLRRRFLAAASATLAVAHVPDLTTFAMSRCVKACPLVFWTVARSSFTRGLVVAAFVPTVVGSVSDYGHVG